MTTRAIEQHTGADYIGVNEIGWVVNATIDVRFSSKVYDSIKLMLGHERVHLIGIRDIGLEELVAIAVLLRNPLEIGKIAGVGQDINITDGGRLVMFQNVANKVAANEAAATCHQNAHRLAY